MQIRFVFVLIITLLGVSACVLEPIGSRGGGYRGDHTSYRGGGGSDEGRRVWR